MRSHIVLGVLLTFLVGFFFGGYLYVSNVAPVTSNIGVPDAEDFSKFTVVSNAYGGCRSVCPSFEVSDDGSYRFLYTPSVGAEEVLQSGSLPSSVVRDLRKNLISSVLVAQSKSVEENDCSSASDGVDISYTITLNGFTYNLDSCSTAIDGTSELWQSLSSVWEYFNQL